MSEYECNGSFKSNSLDEKCGKCGLFRRYHGEVTISEGGDKSGYYSSLIREWEELFGELLRRAALAVPAKPQTREAAAVKVREALDEYAVARWPEILEDAERLTKRAFGTPLPDACAAFRAASAVDEEYLRAKEQGYCPHCGAGNGDWATDPFTGIDRWPK